MNQPPYRIVKHYRGQYQVLDANDLSLANHYVSLHEARQLVIEHKLQFKALYSPKVLQAAECYTMYTGDSLHNWLYCTLIRFDKDELRLVIKKPKKLKMLYEAQLERLKKKLNENNNKSEDY